MLFSSATPDVLSPVFRLPPIGLISLVFINIGLLLGSLPGDPCWAQGSSASDLNSQTSQVLVAYHSLSGNTRSMALSVVEGARSVPHTRVILQKVDEVTKEILFGSDAVVVGSPVYWSNMAGEVKTFFDRWQFEFGVFPEFKMRNKVGAAFATGGQVSSGKEVTMLTILAAMLGNQMIVVSEGGAFGASATTEGDSPGINAKEKAQAFALGKRVAEVAQMIKRGRNP